MLTASKYIPVTTQRIRNMFERYTENARRVIFFARYEASQYGSPYIETEHLLLGLMREGKALGNRFLHMHAQSIRKEIESRTTIGSRISTSIEIPLSEECERILNYALEEAERLDHKQVGTEHLLMGMLREDQCFAACILRAHEVTLAQVRGEEVTRDEPAAAAKRVGDWCCPEFQAQCHQPGKKENGIVSVFTSNAGIHFAFHHPRHRRVQTLKFCPWCGCNLAEWYKSGLPAFQPPRDLEKKPADPTSIGSWMRVIERLSPGRYLKSVRERLNIQMRQVQEASMLIAAEEGNQNFYVSPARLTQIENDESIPSFYKLFTLCSVYGLELSDLLRRYGMPMSVQRTGLWNTPDQANRRRPKWTFRRAISLTEFLKRLRSGWRSSSGG